MPGTCSVTTVLTISDCDADGGKWTKTSTNKWTVKAVAKTAPENYTSIWTLQPAAYNDAVWVDIDLACGQCHGGGISKDSPAFPAKTGIVYFTKATLGAVAKEYHKLYDQYYGSP